MPSWKKVIVSGSDAILKDLTLSGDISNASGDFTLDIDGDMTLDAGGADIILKNAGTEFGRFKRDTSDFIIKSATNNKDIIFRGVDNSATIDALTLDMSDAGKAIFNTHISGSATATASFGHFTSAGVSTSRITGKSPLVIDSDNFNVDSSGNLTIATDATASFGKISGSIEVARSGFIRNSRFRGRSPIAFDTRESDGTATRIEITGSVYASADITGSYLKVDGFKGNWTNAGNTVADGGTFTTIDIDGGTITGITDLAVADGGTGAGTFTDGGVLLGSGTDAITATAVLGNGELLIGDNSGDPTVGTLTGTTNQVTVTNGGGSITLSTPQDLDTSADVTFDSVTLDDLTASKLVSTNGSKKLVSSDLNSFVAGTSNQISVADDGDGTITLSTPQNIHTSATPTFGTITTTGNVTGSSTSTGSFGKVFVHGNILGNSDNTTEIGSTPDNGAIKKIYMVQGGEIAFGDTTTTNFFGIAEGTNNAFSDSDTMGIYYRNGLNIYSANNTQRVKIQANGNVGIGNTNNTYKLDVSGTGRFTDDVTLGADISGSVASTGSFGQVVAGGNIHATKFIGDGSDLTNLPSAPVTALNNATANELVTVGSTTTELDAEANLVFDGTNLGIGTTSPSSYHASPLVTYQASTNYLTIATDTDGISSILMSDGTTGDQKYRGQLEYKHDGDYWNFHAGNSVLATLRSDYGLSVTGPITGSALRIGGATSKFSLSDTTPNGIANTVFGDAQFGSTSTTNTGITLFGTGQVGIAFGDASSELSGQIRYQHGTDEFEIYTGGAERLMIDSDGINVTGHITASGNFVANGNIVGDDSTAITGISTIGAFQAAGAIDFNSQAMTNVDINSGTINGITDLAIADGGTGASTAAAARTNLNAGSGIVSGSSIASSAQGQVALTTNGVAASAVDLGLQTGDSPTFASLTLSGDLTVNGTTTTVNSTTVDIGDKIITLNAGSAAGDGGIYVNDADSAETGSLLWDVSEDRWIGGLKDSEANLVTISSTDTLTNKTLTSPDINTPDIDGGTIDNTVIGGSTAAAGTFTTLTASGKVSGSSTGSFEILHVGKGVGGNLDSDFGSSIAVFRTAANAGIAIDPANNTIKGVSDGGGYALKLSGNIVYLQDGSTTHVEVGSTHSQIPGNERTAFYKPIHLDPSNAVTAGEPAFLIGSGPPMNTGAIAFGADNIKIYRSNNSLRIESYNGIGLYGSADTLSATVDSKGINVVGHVTASGNFRANGNIVGDGSTVISGIATLTSTNINAFTLGGKLTAGANEIEGSAFDINGGTVDAITTLTTGNITSALALKDGGGNTVFTYGTEDLSADDDLEIKIGDVDSATTGTYLSIKPYSEAVDFGTASLTIDGDIVHKGDVDTKISMTTDQIQFKAGNVNMLTLAESTADTATFVADTIDIGDAVISGSINSSGSFGKMVVGGTFANSGSTVFKVQGQQGTLFSIVDEMSGSIFSANTQAGIPVIEAFSDQSVTLGPAGNPFTIKADGNVTMSSTTTASFGRIEATKIVGNSPLIVESDNFNVDADGNLSIATTATASIGTVSATIDVPTTGFIRSRRFRGRSPISFDTEDTRIEVTGSVFATGAVTASGNISASGTIVASNLSGTNTGNSQTTFTLAGDGGSSQTISNGNTLTVAGGDGITTTASNTDTVTVALDANLSTVNNLFSTSLKIGAASDDEYIDFGTDAMIKFAIDDVEDFRMADGGTFHANADIIAYSSTVASDKNLKTNIIDTKYGLGDVLKLQGREFDWKREDRGHDVGFIAQEVQEVIPELVKEVDSIGENEGEKHLAVDYAKLVPVLVESIKELKQEIEEIKQKCDCLNK